MPCPAPTSAVPAKPPRMPAVPHQFFLGRHQDHSLACWNVRVCNLLGRNICCSLLLFCENRKLGNGINDVYCNECPCALICDIRLKSQVADSPTKKYNITTFAVTSMLVSLSQLWIQNWKSSPFSSSNWQVLPSSGCRHSILAHRFLTSASGGDLSCNVCRVDFHFVSHRQ